MESVRENSNLRKEAEMEMEDTIGIESGKLYAESSILRTMAKMLKANGDTERPEITFTVSELDGFSTLLIGAADNIDVVRDNLPNIAR